MDEVNILNMERRQTNNKETQKEKTNNKNGQQITNLLKKGGYHQLIQYTSAEQE